VRVLGRRNDVPELLCAADVLLVPSRWFEAFSLVLAEAAACGTAAVASRVGGIPEVLLDGETGLLVPPGDPPALLEAATRLLADDGLRARLGAAARRRAAAAFCLERMVTATLDEYRTLLACTPPALSAVQATRSA
jgi:glycosyltransferase involved in cell wall biosynthesis